MSDSMKQNQPGRHVDSGSTITRRNLFKGTAAVTAAATLGSAGTASAQSNCVPPFPGIAVPPSDPRYQSLVVGFNQRFVGTPDAVHVVGNTDEVVSVVQNAVNSGKRITVRGGGHCYEGFVSLNAGGVIVDLSPMNHVYVDDSTPDTVVIEGGCTLWNVYSQLFKEYNRTIPGGSCYSVGAGGHICGGGYGLLSRMHGLTIDYLYGVEVVSVDQGGTARKSTVTRDSQSPSEADLYWGVRGGGGGNFGIITKYFFKLDEIPQPPKQVALSNLAWDWKSFDRDTFKEFLISYGAIWEKFSSPGQPTNSIFSLLKLTHISADQIVMTMQEIMPDNARQADLGREVVKRLEKIAGPAVAQRAWIPYHAPSSSSSDERIMSWIEATQTLNGSGANQRGKYKSAYMLQTFPDGQADAIFRYLTGSDDSDPSYSNPQALLQVDSYGGQINAAASSDTAIPQRSSIMKLQYQTYWTHLGDDQYNLDWIRQFYQAVYGDSENKEPTPDAVVDGCYINYPDVDLVNWQTLYYKDNYPRLQRVKSQWDPTNVFHHAQSIELPS